MVACFVRDEEVVGSNPATPTTAGALETPINGVGECVCRGHPSRLDLQVGVSRLKPLTPGSLVMPTADGAGDAIRRLPKALRFCLLLTELRGEDS